jgi:hypothetical protein
MRVGRFDDDDLDIGWMVRDASSSWIGPSPRAAQSRWAGGAQPLRQVGRAVKVSAAAVAFAAVIFVSVVFAAIAVTPGATGTPMTKLTNGVSHVFAGGAVASPSQPPAIPAAAQSPTAVGPRPGTAPSTGSSPLSKRGPGPAPSPTSRPTPRPSGSPDE